MYRIILVLFSFVSLSVAAAPASTTYFCGQLQYIRSSEKPVGGKIYSVIISEGKVFLLSKAMNPAVKPVKTQMTRSGGAGELVRYSAGDIEAHMIRNIRTHGTDVSIAMASNSDWQASCEKQ